MIAVRSSPDLVVSTPFSVGAPTSTGLLWGEVWIDYNASGQRDSGDRAAGELALVIIAGPDPSVQERVARTDGRGRFLAVPLLPGIY
ncbi:MAG: hypothetical protein C4345_06475, partial [Chloroflexota bacterium]